MREVHRDAVDQILERLPRQVECRDERLQGAALTRLRHGGARPASKHRASSSRQLSSSRFGLPRAAPRQRPAARRAPPRPLHRPLRGRSPRPRRWRCASPAEASRTRSRRMCRVPPDQRPPTYHHCVGRVQRWAMREHIEMLPLELLENAHAAKPGRAQLIAQPAVDHVAHWPPWRTACASRCCVAQGRLPGRGDRPRGRDRRGQHARRASSSAGT